MAGGRDPSREEFALLAYHFFEMCGRQHGKDVDDWLVAEQELARHDRQMTLEHCPQRLLVEQQRH